MQAGAVRRIASDMAEMDASSSKRTEARLNSEDNSPFIPTHIRSADSCVDMTTRIVFASAFWLFDRDAVPDRGTSVMVLARFTQPRHKATLVARARRPYFSLNPIE